MKIVSWLLCLLLAVSLVACKPSVPDRYIQPGKMEDILYDYHLAMAMAEPYIIYSTPGGASVADGSAPRVFQQAYKLAVLEKHGVTEAQFETSLQYYLRHADRLHDIYEGLSERFEKEAVNQGASVSGVSSFQNNANSDTIDIWKWERSVILTPVAPYHLFTFSMKTDTTFHVGDQILLRFNPQFVVQDGTRDGVAVMAVKFQNDSISSQSVHLMGNYPQSFQITDNSKLGIKEIGGYFMFMQESSQSATTMKLLLLTNIQMLRIHSKEFKEQTLESSDTIPADSGNAVPEAKPIRSLSIRKQ